MRILLLLFTHFLFFACTNGDGQTLLSPNEFEKKMQTQTGVLLDIRTKDEFQLDRIPNATNLDFYFPKFEEEVKKLDKSKTYYLYCQRESRSVKAVETFHKNGFKNVYYLQGGIMGWEKEGKPIEKATGTLPKGLTVEEYNKLIKSDKLVLIDFSAKWCGPCRKLSPELEKMGKKRAKDVKVIMIDVDDNPAIAQQQNINELPTMIWYKNGQLALRMVGYYPENYINETLDDLLKKK